MVKDGKDGHGLKTTKLKILGQTFQTVYLRLCPFNVIQSLNKESNL